MTDPIPTPETLTDNPSTAQPEAATVDSLPDWAQRLVRELRAEAATHRTAVTEATTARDEARGELGKLHRRDALTGLSKTLADPDDLARYVNVDELVDEAGNPDPARYQEAAKSLALERPHLSATPRAGKSGNPVGGAGAWPLQGIDAGAAAQAGTDAFVSMVNGTQ